MIPTIAHPRGREAAQRFKIARPATPSLSARWSYRNVCSASGGAAPRGAPARTVMGACATRTSWGRARALARAVKDLPSASSGTS